MQILLTNDDGIHAPGLLAIEQELRRMGDVDVVCPATEQSGVGHSITLANPLICNGVYEGERRRGWAIEGSPADCVKLGIFKLCRRRPDLVVSGMNCGLNAGINVLYSGTVAAAIEGAFFDITSIAVSLDHEEHPPFDRAARIAARIIRQILDGKDDGAQLYNLNIPAAAVDRPRGVRVVPMDVAHTGGDFAERTDPRGRTYYWPISDRPTPSGEIETDLAALAEGLITLTPLNFDMTRTAVLEKMRHWRFELDG